MDNRVTDPVPAHTLQVGDLLSIEGQYHQITQVSGLDDLTLVWLDRASKDRVEILQDDELVEVVRREPVSPEQFAEFDFDAMGL